MNNPIPAGDKVRAKGRGKDVGRAGGQEWVAEKAAARAEGVGKAAVKGTAVVGDPDRSCWRTKRDREAGFLSTFKGNRNQKTKRGNVMPGFNQRGPMNEGPMTGRSLGRCAAPGRDIGGIPDTIGSFPGYGRGPGKAMGRGRCRRTWWGVDAAGDSQGFRPLPPAREEGLVVKVRQLENELEAIKNRLKTS